MKKKLLTIAFGVFLCALPVLSIVNGQPLADVLRDLLDQPSETSFESEELQEFWVEEVRRNSRIIVLGAKWNF